MKRLLLRIVVIVAIVEVVYLAVVNVVLNLPATQAYINQLRPERVVYHWDRAWSWLPFSVHATNFSINGQSWSQQYAISAPSVTASLAILPLLTKTIYLYDIDSADITVRFRPRPSSDRDDAALRQYYPTIEGRDPNLAADPVPSQTPGWKTVFDVARIGGQNDLWLAAARMTLVGEAEATVTRQNLNGPLTISDGQADLAVKSFTIAGRQVSHDGSIKGTFDFATFLPQENRGLKLLAFVSLDADIDLPVEGLNFLDFYLRAVSGMKLGGNGTLKGHVAYAKGDLAAGSDVAITADDLTVELPPYSAEGAGAVGVKVDAASPDTIAANVHFTKISAFLTPQNQTLFTGTDLDVAVARSTRLLPGADAEKVPRRVALTIRNVTVPDVSAYQRYLPDKWNVEVLGGTGSLDGQAEMSGADLNFDLTLRSDDAEVKFTASSFKTGLVVGLKAKGEADAKTARVDISGTSIDLDDSRVKAPQGDNSAPWQTHLSVSQGEAAFGLPDQVDAAVGFVGFWSLFHAKDTKTLLATVDGELKAALTVSDLNWVNTLFKNPYSLAVYNSAEVEADVTLRSGQVAEGSSVKMPSRDFKVEVLDYVAEGSGGFDLIVEKGGAQPDLRLDANLANASLKLQDETTAVVEDVTLAVTATAEGVSLKNGGSVKTVEMSIPSAKITDMTAYNAYLPNGSPVRMLSGTGELSAKLDMEENTAGGFVKLQTSRVEADLDGLRIAGTVALNVAIDGGAARDKSFDIGGSSLTLDGVSVAGEPAAGGNWTGRVDIGKGHVVWKRPMTLDVSAGLRMSDARPVLAIFQAQRKTSKWLDHLLDLKNIRGNATIKVAPNQVVVPYALATSDTIDVGAKGIIGEHNRQGMFYARDGKLAAILEIDNDQKHFELIDATGKFDRYVPGGPLPGMRQTDPLGTATEPKSAPFSLFKRK